LLLCSKLNPADNDEDHVTSTALLQYLKFAFMVAMALGGGGGGGGGGVISQPLLWLSYGVVVAVAMGVPSTVLLKHRDVVQQTKLRETHSLCKWWL